MEQRSRSSGEQRTAPRKSNNKIEQSTITNTTPEAHGFNPWVSA
jgi:hypothetical protein